MKLMRIAVVSTDKKKVDDRFSNAQRFLIYEADNKGLSLIAERYSEPLPLEFFDQDMFNWVADIIQDCQQVYMVKVKKGVESALRKRGIMPVIYAGEIADIAVSFQ